VAGHGRHGLERFSIADPSDPGMLDVVGFDTATPQLISDFACGVL
jgi:60 kDa SS-A/Ro ribonucleoprotein